MSYLDQVQNLDWASPSRIFATDADVFNGQPNYEHEVVMALDTGTKYQGVAPVVGGWAFADGSPVPVPPPDPVEMNDHFTYIYLAFEGIKLSQTLNDTNGAGIPRVWEAQWVTEGGVGALTNVGELYGKSALLLDGKTVHMAPDSVVFDFKGLDFTIRGHFFCDFPSGVRRTLVGKSDRKIEKYVFWCDRTIGGFFSVGVDTVSIIDHTLQDRSNINIVDRYGEFIVTRFTPPVEGSQHVLQSTTVYTDVTNRGWHSFKFTRHGSTLNLAMDGIIEATAEIGSEIINALPGPITIGGYGYPVDGPVRDVPWIGGLDRFAVDIGMAR